MNNINNKTVRDRFVAISHLTITALAKLNCLASYTLYFYLSSKQTFKNGLVGVFEELTIYDVSKYLSEALNKNIDTTTAKYYLNKLEKNNLIKTHNKKPLLILLVQAEFAENLKTLEEVFSYVQNNEAEFHFNVHRRRANEFYSTFNIQPLATPSPTPSGAKEQALDELIKSRPTRAQPTAVELSQAQAWRAEIDELDPFADSPEFDPFAQHIKKNKEIVERYEQQQRKIEI
ncbi:hypothetical protein DelCs14_2855 [Delftia sp. Cs1-4]|uniref:hypothetical protein n=1 Tax=Delftia sp. (strain Cs1-4) TaxID=742013 RepID=UPI00020E84E4|nr:hypothetical protein [Delftia sp. Cs1-4]AEF89867.1 hypothetical protein DelCs14_2855 [Delftia sp. Cs1-4]